MRNPIRRNKNIGKTQGGRVKGGRANEKLSRVFTRDVWKKLSEESGKWCVLRENPSRDYFHPCSGEDYLRVLERLPDELTSNVKAIVLRRKPKLDIALGVQAWQRYRCVVMNSFPKSMYIGWTRRPSRSAFRFYAPWCGDWIIGEDRATYWLHWTREKIRRYYMYSLFLHEVGHINQPNFHSSRRSEEFAENFALEWARELGELTVTYDEAEVELWAEVMGVGDADDDRGDEADHLGWHAQLYPTAPPPPT